tara:strand:- start:2305 stop:2592 length:288 start_codon:yes stop_codon:yes gene_type:complete
MSAINIINKNTEDVVFSGSRMNYVIEFNDGTEEIRRSHIWPYPTEEEKSRLKWFGPKFIAYDPNKDQFCYRKLDEFKDEFIDIIDIDTVTDMYKI